MLISHPGQHLITLKCNINIPGPVNIQRVRRLNLNPVRGWSKEYYVTKMLNSEYTLVLLALSLPSSALWRLSFLLATCFSSSKASFSWAILNTRRYKHILRFFRSGHWDTEADVSHTVTDSNFWISLIQWWLAACCHWSRHYVTPHCGNDVVLLNTLKSS